MLECFFARRDGSNPKPIFPQSSNNVSHQPGLKKSVYALKHEKQNEIIIRCKGIQLPKPRINPALFRFNISTLCDNQRANIDFIDEITLKNEQKKERYQALNMVISAQIGSQKVIPQPKETTPLDDLIQLTGMPRERAKQYLLKFGKVEKAYSEWQREQGIVKDFMSREGINKDQALFFLEIANFNIIEAVRLKKENYNN